MQEQRQTMLKTWYHWGRPIYFHGRLCSSGGTTAALHILRQSYGGIYKPERMCTHHYLLRKFDYERKLAYKLAPSLGLGWSHVTLSK
jgi:hypothetical protein